MTPAHIDTSDGNYSATLRDSLEAYEVWLKSGDSKDLRKWVILDREVSRIRNERQKQAQAQGRELRVRLS